MKGANTSLIPPTLRRLASALAVIALSSQLAHANPYASGLVKNGNTVTFVLNQPAAGITVFRDGAHPVTPAIDATTKGVKTFDMTGYSTYSIIVTGNTAKGWVQISSDSLTQSKYSTPRGVTVDTNPKRSTFGRIVVAEAVGGAAAGRTTTDGLYIMTADQGDIYGQGNTAFGGGVDWATGGNASPWRIALNQNDPLGQDYTIYIADWSDAHSGVWTADGLNPSTAFMELLDNTGRDTSGLVLESYGAGPGSLHGSISSGPWVEGVGANRVMFTLDEDMSLGNIWQYNIGTTTSGYSTAPTARVTDGADNILNSTADVVRDADGSWWMAQYRSTDTAGVPALSHWADNATGPSWTSGASTLQLNFGYGNLDIFTPQHLIALGSINSLIYVIDVSDPNNPRLVASIPHTGGSTVRDVSFDAAGNIYAVSGNSQTLRIYSPGGYTVATTKSDGTFELRSTDSFSVAATDALASETGPDPATFTISRSGGLADNVQVSFTLSGTATSNVDYTVSPTSPFTFPANQATATITITPNDDGVREGTETIVLTLANGGSSYSVLSPTTATAILLDDDASYSYWDVNGSTPDAVNNAGDPANGTWGTDAFWSPDPAGAAATGAWDPSKVAVFSAGSGAFNPFTVTVNGAQRADTLSFEDASVTLQGGTLTLTNFSGVQVALGLTATINSVLDGQAGLTVDGPGTVVLGGANTYSGPTLINNGTVQLDAADRIPDSSAVTLGNSFLGTVATLDLANYSETIGSLDGLGTSSVNRSLVNVPDGQTLVFGGNNKDMFWNGTTSGNGLLAKVGTGTLDFGVWGDMVNPLAISNGVLKVDSQFDLGGSATTTPIYLDGGLIRRGVEGTLIEAPFPGTRSLIIGPAGGTLEIVSASAVFYWGTTSEGAGGTIQGGVLTCQGPGEFRTYNNHNTNVKLIVKDGFLFSAGQSTYPGFADSFGAIPDSFAADAITLQTGGQIRKVGGANVALDPKQGIFLGTGGGAIRSYDGNGAPNNSGTFEITGTISGTGALQLNAAGDAIYGPIIVLSGTNNYSGGTTLPAGTVFVRNTAGSATGSGAVTVTGGTLGGDGIIGGPVTLQSATLSPGYAYNTGPQPEVVQPIAKLTLTNGLNLSSAGIVSWQLGALSTLNPGTDFDQVQLTGGNLTLGGTSVLALGFTNTATAPDAGEPFWQENRQWQVIKFGGGGAITGNFSAISGTNGITAGKFTTTTDAAGVNLVYSIPTAPAGVTNMTVVSGPGAGQVTITYLGGGGNQFVLMRTNALAGSPPSRQGWERVATNSGSPASFTITPGSVPAAFYYIKSE